MLQGVQLLAHVLHVFVEFLEIGLAVKDVGLFELSVQFLEEGLLKVFFFFRLGGLLLFDVVPLLLFLLALFLLLERGVLELFLFLEHECY